MIYAIGVFRKFKKSQKLARTRQTAGKDDMDIELGVKYDAIMKGESEGRGGPSLDS